MAERFRWLEWSERPEPAPPAPLPDHDPGLARRWLEEGERALLDGDPEPALRSFARALGEDRGLAAAWAGQVVCLLAMEELEPARVWALKALEADQGAPEIQAAAALVFSRAGDHEQALALSGAALAGCGPEDRRRAVRLHHGRCLLAAGRQEEAWACLEGLPDEPDWHLRAGEAALAAGHPLRALGWLTRAREGAPERAAAWLLAARAARACGERAEAEACLRRFEQLRPADPRPARERARWRAEGAGAWWRWLKASWGGDRAGRQP